MSVRTFTNGASDGGLWSTLGNWADGIPSAGDVADIHGYDVVVDANLKPTPGPGEYDSPLSVTDSVGGGSVTLADGVTIGGPTDWSELDVNVGQSSGNCTIENGIFGNVSLQSYANISGGTFGHLTVELLTIGSAISGGEFEFVTDKSGGTTYSGGTFGDVEFTATLDPRLPAITVSGGTFDLVDDKQYNANTNYNGGVIGRLNVVYVPGIFNGTNVTELWLDAAASTFFAGTFGTVYDNAGSNTYNGGTFAAVYDDGNGINSYLAGEFELIDDYSDGYNIYEATFGRVNDWTRGGNLYGSLLSLATFEMIYDANNGSNTPNTYRGLRVGTLVLDANDQSQIFECYVYRLTVTDKLSFDGGTTWLYNPTGPSIPKGGMISIGG